MLMLKRKDKSQAISFAPYTTKASGGERIMLILLLLLAVFLRLYRLNEVPPGIHNDEIINAQIVDELRAGSPVTVFYEAGGGREGFYHLLLLASRTITAAVPYWYRLPSVASSLLTILLVYLLSRRWFGPWTALVAVGGLAVTFWPVFLGREALRAGTFPLLSAGMAVALWRGLEWPGGTGFPARSGNRVESLSHLLWFALAGLLLGLTPYTYLAARTVPLFIALFITYLALFHRDRLRLHWRGVVLFLAVGLLIATPLAIYLGTHWEQQERITLLSEPLQSLLTGDPAPVLSSAAATVGMFVWRGDLQPHYNLPGRPVFEPVGSLLFLGGVLIALSNLRHPGIAFCLLWTAVTLVPGMLTEPAPHFVRAAGALVTTFIFPGLAVSWAVRQGGHKWRIGLAVLLGLLLSANTALTSRDYFHRWPALDGVRSFRHAGLAEVARYLDRVPDTTPVAACTPFLNERHPFWRTDRQALPYLLNRRDLGVGWYSCLEAQLFPRGGQVSRYLFPDEWYFAPFMPPEWIDQAETIAMVSNNQLVRLDLADELEAWLAQLTRPIAPALSFGQTMSYGQTMSFLGYQTGPAAPVPGGTLEVLTAWRVLDTPPNDLAIFLHLYHEDGAVVAQGDALGALTDTFQPEDVFVQWHGLALPPDLPQGKYRLGIGLYIREGRRLPLDSGAGDTLTLGTVEIVAGGD
jgi:4-amino-4-deoxy-L-arabinose transferase-like glycosyltransferase